MVSSRTAVLRRATLPAMILTVAVLGACDDDDPVVIEAPDPTGTVFAPGSVQTTSSAPQTAATSAPVATTVTAPAETSAADGGPASSSSPAVTPGDGIDVAGAIDAGAATVWGMHLFEARPSDDVITVVSDRLGEPSSDTGYLPITPEFECTGSTAYRVVRFGDLRLTFVDNDPATAAEPDASTQEMIAWSIGDDAAAPLAPVDEPPAQPEQTGLTTTTGIGIGSSRAELSEAYTPDQVLDGFDGDRVHVVAAAGTDGVPTATTFLLADDVVTGIGAGPPDCVEAPD